MNKGTLAVTLAIALMVWVAPVQAAADGRADCVRNTGCSAFDTEGESTSGSGGVSENRGQASEPSTGDESDPGVGADDLVDDSGLAWPQCSSLEGRQMYRPDAEGSVKQACLVGELLTAVWVKAESDPVSPAETARTLVSRLKVRPIGLGMSPDGQTVRGLVGLPTWLWVANPDRESWGPATIRAGQVWLTAEVEGVEWDMGDGTTVRCGLGTKWRLGLDGESPTCGHTYSRRGEYQVRATSQWVARWSGHRESGTIRFTTATSRTIEVGENQVIRTEN